MAGSHDTLTILCSGASLGAYVPGLLIANQLADKGRETEVELLENQLLTSKRDNLQKTKFAFHRNFSLAQIAQKMAVDIAPSLDWSKVDNLLSRWQREGRHRFIVIYGFWMPIIERYRRQANDPGRLTFDLCHMDAVTSVSWKPYPAAAGCFRHIRFFDWDTQSLPWRLQVASAAPLSYRERNGRFLIHGGGWGLGSYQHKIPELCAHGMALDVTVYEEADLTERLAGNRYFMIDPSWKPWERDAGGRHRFPPFGEVAADGSVAFGERAAYPEVYELVRRCQAIISKPGGSTLVDSLSAATPLVLLEPYGEHERKNGELWQSLGFAISYDQWAATGFSPSVLRTLHDNLQQARLQAPSYIAQYVQAMDGRDPTSR